MRSTLEPIIDKSVLKNLSFQLNDNDRVGIIGKNGAGKTTLLRVLSKIIKPSLGQVFIDGKIASLFGPLPFISNELTARENIKNYCQLTEIAKTKIPEIIEDIRVFTELGEYFEQPLSVYSAGMLTRFTFGLMTSFEREIVILDEGIGAGDHFFQGKVTSRLDEVYSKASILVVASHSEGLIKSVCNKCLWIENGQLLMMGDVNECLSLYKEKG
tara:strand:+ start:927 stop:1568 length:642 start_codon:yes stop_codon:yes gene_type:complete